MLGARFAGFVKARLAPAPGERGRGRLPDPRRQEPEHAGARALSRAAGRRPAARGTDLVLVWGEGSTSPRCRRGARTIFLNAYAQPENARADVFIPISIQTERTGHYTNFEGVVSAFEPCFPKPPAVADAADAVRRAGARAEALRMMQDLVVSLVFIGYAIGVLMTFGTVLTWVERKQAARSCPTASAPTAPTCASRSRRSSSSGGACSTAWPTA